MVEDAPFLPGLSPVAGKPVHLAFDGGRLTSDAGVLGWPSAWHAASRIPARRNGFGMGLPR
jgi:hypothetical protein